MLRFSSQRGVASTPLHGCSTPTERSPGGGGATSWGLVGPSLYRGIQWRCFPALFSQHICLIIAWNVRVTGHFHPHNGGYCLIYEMHELNPQINVCDSALGRGPTVRSPLQGIACTPQCT